MSVGLSLRHQGVCTLALAVLQGLMLVGTARAICYSTPHAALDAVASASLSSSTSGADGYRVMRIESDPILHQRWALIGSCSHPEWPAVALLLARPDLPLSSTVTQQWKGSVQAATVVRAGETVQLWSQGDVMRIEVAGVSEENGGLGASIRVRLLRGNLEDPSVPSEFTGIIRGPSSVEIQP
jgi:Chaperone for flagella basal body P-ring formation